MGYYIMPFKQTTAAENSISTMNSKMTTANTNITNINNKLTYRSKTLTHSKAEYDISIYVSGYMVSLNSFNVPAATYNGFVTFTVGGTKRYYIRLFTISHSNVTALFKNSAVANASYADSNRYGFCVGYAWVRKNTTGNITTSTLRLIRENASQWILGADALSNTDGSNITISPNWYFMSTQHLTGVCN